MAHMPDASLSDRVEAAAKAFADAWLDFIADTGCSPEFVSASRGGITFSPDGPGATQLDAFIEAGIAAADACGAERNPNTTDALTREQREAIADEVLAERKTAFERSFAIDCPLCGRAAGHACMNLGSAGGPSNHVERIDAAVSSEDVHREAEK